MELDVLATDGSSSGKKVKLPDHVFGVEPNEHAVYLAIKSQQANSRQGTASSKTRSMVSGGGRKPWRQKGRGAARAGSTRSGVWVGGGRIFGPEPRQYKSRLPKKVKAIARTSVYSDMAKSGKVKLIEDFQVESAKTKEMFGILKSLELVGKKTLLLLTNYDQNIVRAGRNIPRLEIRVATSESTFDLMNCETIVIQKGAVEKISGVFAK